MILFKHCDPRFPFLWESAAQPAARWHGDGDGPVHYFADTPSGAWAEFLRHEEITEETDLAGVVRAMWAVEVALDAMRIETPALSRRTLIGGRSTYPACQAEATRLRGAGARGLKAPSAALKEGGASGWQVMRGEKPAARSNGRVFAIFGALPEAIGWPAVERGAPPARLLDRVRHF